MLVGSLPPPKQLPPGPGSGSSTEGKRRGRKPKINQEEAADTPAKDLPIFRGARVWTEEEAEGRRTDIEDMLEGYFQDTDRILSLISRKPQVVWSDMSQPEMKLLVDFVILRVQHSPEAARTVAIAMEYRVYVGVAAACLPRAFQTFLISIEASVEAIKRTQKPAKRGRVVDAINF